MREWRALPMPHVWWKVQLCLYQLGHNGRSACFSPVHLCVSSDQWRRKNKQCEEGGRGRGRGQRTRGEDQIIPVLNTCHVHSIWLTPVKYFKHCITCVVLYFSLFVHSCPFTKCYFITVISLCVYNIIYIYIYIICIYSIYRCISIN